LALRPEDQKTTKITKPAKARSAMLPRRSRPTVPLVVLVVFQPLRRPDDSPLSRAVRPPNP
jgi:hypothetical protein